MGDPYEQERVLATVTRLIIAGSRTVDPSFEEIDAAFDDILFVKADVTEVVSGCAPGGDLAGERWATFNGIKIASFMINDADRVAVGGSMKLAPKMRNRRMAEYGDLAIVFWDGLSGGSCDMTTRMVVRGKPARVIPTKKRKR
jgi:hypothetical protein